MRHPASYWSPYGFAGPFSPDPAHQHRLGAEVLGHRFAQLRDAALVPDATLHRLRHSVATFLVARGQILAAQARLGHADAATTLREYAHALPLTDRDVADAIDGHLHHPEDQARAASERDSRKGGGNSRAVTSRDLGSGS